MLRTTALARLRLNVQPDADPTLTSDELDTILDLYALQDANGAVPGEDAWLGLWDIRAASRKAWQVKAAKVVSDVDYDVDGSKYTQSQLTEHCLKQADLYADQGSATIEGVGGLT